MDVSVAIANFDLAAQRLDLDRGFLRDFDSQVSPTAVPIAMAFYGEHELRAQSRKLWFKVSTHAIGVLLGVTINDFADRDVHFVVGTWRHRDAAALERYFQAAIRRQGLLESLRVFEFLAQEPA